MWSSLWAARRRPLRPLFYSLSPLVLALFGMIFGSFRGHFSQYAVSVNGRVLDDSRMPSQSVRQITEHVSQGFHRADHGSRSPSFFPALFWGNVAKNRQVSPDRRSMVGTAGEEYPRHHRPTSPMSGTRSPPARHGSRTGIRATTTWTGSPLPVPKHPPPLVRQMHRRQPRCRPLPHLLLARRKA